MIWWVLGLSALFVWGGILAVKPSPAQKRLAGMRQAAIEKGLRVRLGSQLKLEVPTDLSRLVGYLKHRSRSVKNCTGLLLLDYETGAVKHATGLFARSDSQLEQLLHRLPSGCTLVSSNGNEVLIGWDEAGGEAEIAAIADVLEELLEWTAGKRGQG